MLRGAPDEIAATARPYGPHLRDDLVRTDSSQPRCQRLTGVHARIHASTHDLVLIPLPQDFPPLDEQLRSKTRRVVAPLGRVRPLEPGDSGTFAVDLAPGRYGMVSFVTGPNGTPDARKGMTSEFRVG